MTNGMTATAEVQRVNVSETVEGYIQRVRVLDERLSEQAVRLQQVAEQLHGPMVEVRGAQVAPDSPGPTCATEVEPPALLVQLARQIQLLEQTVERSAYHLSRR